MTLTGKHDIQSCPMNMDGPALQCLSADWKGHREMGAVSGGLGTVFHASLRWWRRPRLGSSVRAVAGKWTGYGWVLRHAESCVERQACSLFSSYEGRPHATITCSRMPFWESWEKLIQLVWDHQKKVTVTSGPIKGPVCVFWRIYWHQCKLIYST